MRYRVFIDRQAVKRLAKVPAKIRKQIKSRIDDLASNPRPHGYKELKGAKGYFRIRSGDYRVIYTIADDVLLVSVLEIDDRKDIY